MNFGTALGERVPSVEQTFHSQILSFRKKKYYFIVLTVIMALKENPQQAYHSKVLSNANLADWQWG